MKKILRITILCLLVIIISGCSNPFKEITVQELQKSLENKESFILEIMQDGCSNCESFNPKFKKILSKNELEAKRINLSNLSEEDKKTFDSLFNVSGTPTVIFIENGEETAIYKRIVGNVENSTIIEKLKNAGYIK